MKNKYIKIKWQEGTVKDVGKNGVQINDVIDTTIDRLKDLDNQYPSQYNKDTLNYLTKAKEAQDARTKDRKQRNVEGSEKA